MKKQGRPVSGSPPRCWPARASPRWKSSLRLDAGEKEGLAWLEAVPKSTDSGFERVRLGFAADAGGELKAMELVDSFGQQTSLVFSKVEKNRRFRLPPSVYAARRGRMCWVTDLFLAAARRRCRQRL